MAPSPALGSFSDNWLYRGLHRTRQRFATLFSKSRLDDAWLEEFEEALLRSDVGVGATEKMLAHVKEHAQTHTVQKEAVHAWMVSWLTEQLRILEPAEKKQNKPEVIMLCGVNGAGKTSTIGKLTHRYVQEGKKVLLACCDTFRAAANEQLVVWAKRSGVDIVINQGTDPASVAYDAVSACLARGCDVVIVDTAGRLPNQSGLMRELEKIKRSLAKVLPEAPHEIWLVLDAYTGQNSLSQFRLFHDTLTLTGLIVTKLDGSAKAGFLVTLALAQTEGHLPKIPVCWLGLGETVDALEPFHARDFVQAWWSKSEKLT